MCCGLWFVVVGGVCSAGVSNALDFGGNKKSESPRSESPRSEGPKLSQHRKFKKYQASKEEELD